jgi:hypothetical protein
VRDSLQAAVKSGESEWEHGMNLCSQPLGMPGEKSCIGGTLERMAEQETRHVHASQSREKVEAPDLPVWSLFGRERET